jgi:Family of unknown function (DUF6788)
MLWHGAEEKFRKVRDFQRKGLTISDIIIMISDMKNTPIERKIERLKQQLAGLGPMHPGSLSEQYNVCGKVGCRCKDAKNPQKHGPYYQLSFTWRGKGRTRFVRAERLAEMREKLANYKRFRELTDEWVDLVVELEQQERERNR